MKNFSRQPLKIRDLTLRDGQQSLFATRMPQSTVERLLPYYEDARFYIMEVWGGAVPDSVMRYLDESPWERLRLCSKAMDSKSAHPKSLLSALSRGRNLFGYVPYPTSVLEGFYKEAIENGLNVMRIFDALNDIDNVADSIRLINQLGGIADGAVCFTVDPKPTVPDAKGGVKGFFSKIFGSKPQDEKIFTDDYFVGKAKAMEALGAKIITLKDMAGLVSPAKAASIIAALKREVNVPVDFHTHCTPGYGLASSLMAIINGVDILDTNIWWFAEGSAAPAIELIYLFCQRMDVEVEVNMEAVGKIRNELKSARQELAQFDLNKDNFPKEFDPLKDKLSPEVEAMIDSAIEFAFAGDEAGLLDVCHRIEAYFNFPKPNELVKNAEVPGGMYSNMVAQLRQLKCEDLLDTAMELIPKVRKDAGLIPLVTPTSQIVGSQAVQLALDRKNGRADYSTCNNQFVSLVKGEYGKTPVAIDPAFREKITGSAEERPYDVNSYREAENPVVAEFGNVKLASNNEEELLLALLPTVANTFLRRRREEEFKATQPEPEVVEEKVEEVIEPITGPTLSAPMGGKIISVAVKDGDPVKKGQILLVYEAMKMENDVEATSDAVVKRVFVKPGDVVGTDAPMIEFQD
ncbi:MAG: biotin/lipoyl-binding protein [Duncaniella sp.]|nr:biotin/lipoyl-binding protein [Duncaniella sp.]